MAYDPQNRGVQLFSPDLRGGLSWRLFVFLGISFLISILSYVGINIGYRAYLDNSIKKYDALIEAGRAKIGPEEEKNLIGFYSQMANLKELFRKHIFASKIFPFLESSTLGRVAYTGVGLSVADRELSIDGVTDSYETLVGQINEFENQSVVEEAILGNNSLEASGVKFGVKIIFKQGFLNAKEAPSKSASSPRPTSPPAAPTTPAPSPAPTTPPAALPTPPALIPSNRQATT